MLHSSLYVSKNKEAKGTKGKGGQKGKPWAVHGFLLRWFIKSSKKPQRQETHAPLFMVGSLFCFLCLFDFLHTLQRKCELSANKQKANSDPKVQWCVELILNKANTRSVLSLVVFI